MKPKNIKAHALMRYAQRVCKEHIINDRTFEAWKRDHAEKVPEIEAALKEDLYASDFVTAGAYEKNKKADFYINPKTMMTFVVIGENLVTCYHIDFGLDSTGNKKMLEVLLENLERNLIAEETFVEDTRERKEVAEAKLNIVNSEIKELNTKLDRAKGERAVQEQAIKNIDLEHKELLESIEAAKEKVVRSKLAV